MTKTYKVCTVKLANEISDFYEVVTYFCLIENYLNNKNIYLHKENYLIKMR